MGILIDGNKLQGDYIDGRENGAIFVVKNKDNNKSIKVPWIFKQDQELNISGTHIDKITINNRKIMLKDILGIEQEDKVLMLYDYVNLPCAVLIEGNMDENGLKMSNYIDIFTPTRLINSQITLDFNILFDKNKQHFLVEQLQSTPQLKPHKLSTIELYSKENEFKHAQADCFGYIDKNSNQKGLQIGLIIERKFEHLNKEKLSLHL